MDEIMENERGFDRSTSDEDVYQELSQHKARSRKIRKRP